MASPAVTGTIVITTGALTGTVTYLFTLANLPVPPDSVVTLIVAIIGTVLHWIGNWINRKFPDIQDLQEPNVRLTARNIFDKN